MTKAMKAQMKLNFYQQVKLINYIRRQVYLNHCLNCDEKFESADELFTHMKEQNHLKAPLERENWDQSQFYFPTYENDNFLCLIEDDDMKEDGGQVGSDAPVIPQELPAEQEEIINQRMPKMFQKIALG